MNSTSQGSGPRAPRRGLLARLSTGGQRIGELESIVTHLQELLNTRSGESLSAPDFGIVDFADVVHNFPEATQVLQQSIRATILKYEPRLRNVSVHPVPSGDTLMIAFEVSARLASGAQRGVFRVRTEMTSTGKIQVSGR
ncbi:type VI secretion system baseplate subunit TssE [Nannocystis punicea]|uniref:Type VI secretion system baseplate subunit TssE n=1 Tax=Nannocystis punicea TaxID=2995304 RepID=A0ABY7H9M4_9BACT|nr:type VI secretion system baseplate subunit TssE [Nannocystis poenicansa]WAS95838.1 type VI secretion system baseplate subunit TssE [Nannocystis poenicansa]